MITFAEVEKSRTNELMLSLIYNKVFYDGKKPKLRMWLIKKGVSFSELGDVETKMKLIFLESLSKYTHDKIDFERYVWTRFSHHLLCYFQSKTLQKNSVSTFSDVGDEVIVNIGFIPETSYVVDDFELVFTKMTQIQATICRFIYYNDWNKYQISRHLRITLKEYNGHLGGIRKIMKEYLS